MRNQRDPSRCGFTLVELLVVIAIIGILIGLLMPAVQSARESGRRTACSNHLKQIALAFLNHESSMRILPTGGWDWFRPPNRAAGEAQHAGWGYQILPYVEGTNAFESDPLTAIGTPNEIFFCPSRRGMQIVAGEDNYLPKFNVPSVDRALCDYAGSNREQTGALMRIKSVRIADITDGTSNTLLVGEKRINLRYLGQAQDDDNEGYTVGWNEDTIRRTDLPPAPDYSAAAGDGEKLFGGSHPGIVMFSRVDGSVNPVRYTIAPATFTKLGDRNDGQIPDYE
jgi:prepilin-type N-terminal cleavage/methylation domain-containing protein